MPINTNTVHLRYCRLVPDGDHMTVTYRGVPYELKFNDPAYRKGKGLTIMHPGQASPSPDFLIWLSVYIGEDMLDPYRGIDTRFVDARGDFFLRQVNLQAFFDLVQRTEVRRWPRWKKDLFDDAITYYSAAIRFGVDAIPLNLGLFGVSLECLGNVRHGKQTKHHPLGEKRFINLLTKRLVRAKRNPAKRDQVKRNERLIHDDIALLLKVRNCLYGHSLLQLAEDRRELVKLLRSWFVRYGHQKQFADISFRTTRLRDDIQREAHALYKLGLRLNRMFLFLALGRSRHIPFATHDWHLLADHRDGEEKEFRGVIMSFTGGKV